MAIASRVERAGVCRAQRSVGFTTARPSRQHRAANGRSIAARAMPDALLFDCDGVLVDTERDGHRVAFNDAFRRMGARGVQWMRQGGGGCVHGARS